MLCCNGPDAPHELVSSLRNDALRWRTRRHFASRVSRCARGAGRCGAARAMLCGGVGTHGRGPWLSVGAGALLFVVSVVAAVAGCTSTAWISTRGASLATFPVPFRSGISEDELRAVGSNDAAPAPLCLDRAVARRSVRTDRQAARSHQSRADRRQSLRLGGTGLPSAASDWKAPTRPRRSSFTRPP